MLNLAVLNVNSTSSRSSARLRDAAIARGHSITLLAAVDLNLAATRNRLALIHRGEELPRFDLVIPRLSAASDPFGLTALRHFEALGAKALNSSNAIALSHDKFATLQKLAGAHLPVPPSATVHRSHDIARAIDVVGGAPIVIKTILGSQGVGVMLADTVAQASAIAETMIANKIPIFFQRFYGEANGSDIRAFVVGDTVVAAMRRTARPGEFRSNLHRGGSAEPIALDGALLKLAVDAAQNLGLAVAGVDIIESTAGPLVLEVNSSPGLTGIESTTTVDIGEAIVAYGEKFFAGESIS